ncbi:transcriptional regulator, TetR family [Filimonas lacunae]|uniref:Transcriptional regulator, TetR family n=2 Tax=Filimonas lacunae TaxID=477680 RepID=A0A1N7RDP7_9BACT|nr:transcriptional regulator, TetR family [Filimonas lacunae]
MLYQIHFSDMSTDKKEHIILTAINLFATKGFEGTSIREIAAAANVNLAMINYYFGSKEKLFESIIDYKATYSRGAIADLVNDTTLSYQQKISQIIDGYVDRLFSNRNFHRLLYHELVTNTRPELQLNIVNNIIYPNTRTISALIDDGIKAGEFNQVDAKLTTVSLVGTINQILLSSGYCSKILGNKDVPNYDPYEDEEVKNRVKSHLQNMICGYLVKKQA